MDHITHIERESSTVVLPENVRKAACKIFFGGSFDPPHIGHTQLPKHLADQFADSCTIYVPAARSPFKSTIPTADHHRINMLKIALGDFQRCAIWEQELNDSPLNLNQPSYWADTWAIVSKMNMQGSNRFLIGADQALSMHRWHRYTEFWQDAVIVLRNDADSTDSLMAQMCAVGVWTKDELDHWHTQIATAPTVDASSTAIRESLNDKARRSKPIPGLNAQVQEYILEHQLYSNAE